MDWHKFWNEIDEAWEVAPLWVKAVVGLVALAIFMRLFGIIH